MPSKVLSSADSTKNHHNFSEYLAKSKTNRHSSQNDNLTYCSSSTTIASGKPRVPATTGGESKMKMEKKLCQPDCCSGVSFSHQSVVFDCDYSNAESFKNIGSDHPHFNEKQIYEVSSTSNDKSVVENDSASSDNATSILPSNYVDEGVESKTELSKEPKDGLSENRNLEFKSTSEKSRSLKSEILNTSKKLSDNLSSSEENFKSRTNLIVNYLPQNMTQEEIHKLFSTIGEVESCKLIREKSSNQNLGYGFVNFFNVKDAEKAISTLNGLRIQNKVIKVSHARPSSETIKGANLYISGLPKTLTQSEIEAMFSSCGRIITSRILYDNNTGISRGVGFIRFDQRKEAELAIHKFNGTIPANFTESITVKLANSPASSSKSGPSNFLATFSMMNEASLCTDNSDSPRDHNTFSSSSVFNNPVRPCPASLFLSLMQQDSETIRNNLPGGFSLSDYSTVIPVTPDRVSCHQVLYHTQQAHGDHQYKRGSASMCEYPQNFTRQFQNGDVLRILATSRFLSPMQLPSVYTQGYQSSPDYRNFGARFQYSLPICHLIPDFSPFDAGISASTTLECPSPSVAALLPGNSLIPSSLIQPPVKETHLVCQANEASAAYSKLSDDWCLFVSNLATEVDEASLWRLFGPFGAVCSVHVVREHGTSKCRGFGFVKMKHFSDAMMAIHNLNGYYLGGRNIHVSFKMTQLR